MSPWLQATQNYLKPSCLRSHEHLQRQRPLSLEVQMPLYVVWSAKLVLLGSARSMDGSSSGSHRSRASPAVRRSNEKQWVLFRLFSVFPATITLMQSVSCHSIEEWWLSGIPSCVLEESGMNLKDTKLRRFSKNWPGSQNQLPGESVNIDRTHGMLLYVCGYQNAAVAASLIDMTQALPFDREQNSAQISAVESHHILRDLLESR